MVDTDAMRASDRDRQEVVDRLRAAVGDGRLQMDEYMERMEAAYEAVTLGELAPLCMDLPARSSVVERKPDAVGGTSPSGVAARPCSVAGASASVARLPGTLRVAWSIWLTAVLVNVTIWVLASATTGHFIYPWPLWVAGPWGAVLFAMSAGHLPGRRVRS